jgi:hypothetical protein
VDTLIVNGDVVVDEGHTTRINEDAVASDAEKAADRLAQAAGVDR